MKQVSKAVVTVLGYDRKGIIAKVSHVLFERSINILDISQTITDGPSATDVTLDANAPISLEGKGFAVFVKQ